MKELMDLCRTDLAVHYPNNNNNYNTTTTTTTTNNNLCSGQRALGLIGWFERAVVLCGGTKAQKQVTSFKFRLLDWRTGYLNWSPVGTDPYSFMKEHVISIEEVSC